MFINQALQLNAWDRLVIANGEKVTQSFTQNTTINEPNVTQILTLNNGIEKVKQQQLQLDHELDFVLAQQRELEECIAPLEKELKEIPITDQDRNHTYQIAENMDTQLKQMSEDLKEIIEHLNESNKTEETNDPVFVFYMYVFWVIIFYLFLIIGCANWANFKCAYEQFAMD